MRSFTVKWLQLVAVLFTLAWCPYFFFSNRQDNQVSLEHQSHLVKSNSVVFKMEAPRPASFHKVRKSPGTMGGIPPTADSPMKKSADNHRVLPNCTERAAGRLVVSGTNLPLTALASPYRSGNTWLRHLLQIATGLGTSSQYCDEELRRGGFPFECSRNLTGTLVVKSHYPGPVEKERGGPGLKFERAVLIIRDPYNFVVSNIHKYHKDIVKEDQYLVVDSPWRQYQPLVINWWLRFNLFWLTDFQGPVLPVLYSSMLKNVRIELRRVLDFLNVTYTEEDINCAYKFKEGNFHRQQIKWSHISTVKDLFEKSVQLTIDNAVTIVATKLKNKYGMDWVNEGIELQ